MRTPRCVLQRCLVGMVSNSHPGLKLRPSCSQYCSGLAAACVHIHCTSLCTSELSVRCSPSVYSTLQCVYHVHIYLWQMHVGDNLSGASPVHIHPSNVHPMCIFISDKCTCTSETFCQTMCTLAGDVHGLDRLGLWGNQTVFVTVCLRNPKVSTRLFFRARHCWNSSV